jgi:AcrR family transcriptional regulator
MTEKPTEATQGASQSVWLRPARSGRGPAPGHSTAEIAGAAITIADAEGLAAVTMRAVAAAIDTAPASLYRYVSTRDELLELMADQVGEYSLDEPLSGQPVTDLLALGHQALVLYHRHPWLLDIPPTIGVPGPNALAYMDRVLAILSGTSLSTRAKFELIGLFTGAVRSFAQLEADQRRTGRDTERWQATVASYLVQVAADGRHPHLAAALAGSAVAAESAAEEPAAEEPLFDRVLTQILTGLLRPTS